MKNQEYKPEVARPTQLDDQLDAALAQYAMVEPRPGLDERVLAHLRVEKDRRCSPVWWKWLATAAVLAALVVAASLLTRSEKPGRDLTVHHPPRVKQQAQPQAGREDVGTSAHRQTSPPRLQSPRRHASRAPAVAVTAVPKLDQFPSPRPLSEQEKLLAAYVEQFPAESALIAKAQTALLEREEKEKLEKYWPPPAGAQPRNRQQFDYPNL